MSTPVLKKVLLFIAGLIVVYVVVQFLGVFIIFLTFYRIDWDPFAFISAGVLVSPISIMLMYGAPFFLLFLVKKIYNTALWWGISMGVVVNFFILVLAGVIELF